VESQGLRVEPAVLEHSGGAHLLIHKQLLCKRIFIQSQVRFLVVAGIVFGTLGAHHIVGVEDMPVAGLLWLAALLALFNTGVFLVAWPHKSIERRSARCPFLTFLMHVTIDVDFVFLTVALCLVGGAKSPFQAFYLLHVILASALLSPRAAWAHAAFGFALLSTLVLGDWWGLIPVHCPHGMVNSTAPLDGRFVLTVLSVYGMLIILSVALLTSLTKLLRAGELSLHTANSELRRLSEIHRDFLHITVHDLKSPISTAIMLLHGAEGLSDPPMQEKQAHLVQRARIRLTEATEFLHDFEVLSDLDAADIEAHGAAIDVALLISDVVAQNQDLAHAQGHSLDADAPDGLPYIHAIGRLIHEAVTNLVTNAIKYTPDEGTIHIRARRQGDCVRIEVEDNGIGVAQEDQKLLFQEFVRIRRDDHPAKAVKGSGLGLSIVRRIVEANGGSVGVESELGKGSVFYIEMPIHDA
jgi:signal transduction histidine kinase